MKSLRLKNLVAAAVVALTVATLSPIGASAEWKQDSNGWWNTEGGSYSVGWSSIDGKWYFFNSDGYMKTGWVSDKGTWYYMQPSGEMKTGWINDGGKWYYAAPSGAMQTGWINDNGTWYFTSETGAMQTGVVEVEGKVYYLSPSGAMATGNVTINGVTYTFAASGEAVGDKIPTPTVSFSRTGAQTTPTKKPSETVPTKSSGGGSSHGSSSTTFQQDIDNKYMKYRDFAVDSDSEGDFVTFKVTFDERVDNSKTGIDYVTQDVFVTNADGTDKDISYSNEEYKAKPGAKVYTVVRVYRDGQIGYVTSDPITVR